MVCLLLETEDLKKPLEFSFTPKDWLIVFCLTSLSRIFHWYGDVTIAGEGLQILAYARHLRPLSREGSLSCHTCCDTGLGFYGLIRRTAPFSRLLRQARGYWGPILTRIPTGPFHIELVEESVKEKPEEKQINKKMDTQKETHKELMIEQRREVEPTS